MIPSSDQIASDSSPCSSRMRADSASAQAECTRPPKGESTHRRQSPISSRKRSTTIVRSLGTTRVASRCSRRKAGQVAGGALVEVVLGSELLRRAVHRLARERADREAELLGRPMPSPFQNGTAPGAPGAGVTITRSRVISSIRQVEAPSRKVWPGARLVDHLLVQLAHAAAVGEVHAVEAAVGDRARVRDRELERAPRARGSCPPPGPRRSAAAARRTPPTGSAVQHVEHAVEQLARQLGERVGAPDGLVERGHLQLLAGRRHRDDLLRQHVERVARHDGRLDVAVAHAPRHHGALEQVGAELGKIRPRETSPTPWPARPMRWRPAVTDLGDSTWITRSTAPMSMPSSSDEVATRQGARPT